MKKFKVKVEIRLKPGILDAEGRTIERAIKRFGIEAENTRKGKIIEFEVRGASEKEVRLQVEKLANELLINALTEEFHLEVSGENA